MGRQLFIQTREVDNPSLTDGLAYSEQRNAHLKIRVEENAMTRMGALCFIRKRESHHERAAEAFKNLYEARYGSGNPAMDPSRVQVDTSPIAHDSGMAEKIDRTYKIKRIEKAMGKDAFNRVVACVVLGEPCGEGEHWRTRTRNVDALLEALDHVAELLFLKSRAA